MLFKYCQYVIGFLIGTNIYIGLVATAIAFTGFTVFTTKNILVASLFVFFATQTAYNLQRYFKWRKSILHPFLIPYVFKTNNSWIAVLIIGVIISNYTGLLLSIKQIELLIVVSLITALYLFVHPISKKLTGLRYIPFLKTLVVAISWTALFFILTFQDHDFEILKTTWQYWLIVFLEIWQACILFDLRDVEVDKGNVKTIANSITTKGLFIFWLIISATILFLIFQKEISMITLALYSIIGMIQLFCIAKKPNPLTFTFLVDGSLLLFAILNYLCLK